MAATYNGAMSTASPSAERRRLALRGMLMLAIAMGIGRFAFTPLLPMMREAGLTTTQGGWLAASNYAGYLAGALAAGAWPMETIPALRAGLAATVVTTALMGATQSFVPWLVLRFLAGVASAVVLVCASSWSVERLKQMRDARLTGVVFAGVGTGIATTGLLCLGLMVASVNAAASWAALGIAALVGTFFAWPRNEALGARATGTPSGKFAWGSRARRLVACYGALGFGYIIPATYLPAMAKEAMPSPALFGWVWPVFGIAAALSTLAVVRRPTHWTLRRTWIAANLVMAAGLVIPALWPTLASMALSGLFIGGTFMVITMVGIQEARELEGVHARTLIAAMTGAFAAGQVAGPLVANALAAWSGTLSASLLLAASVMVASSIGLALDPSHRQPVETPQ
jgi:predicted MFS family arabinose efflux permease